MHEFFLDHLGAVKGLRRARCAAIGTPCGSCSVRREEKGAKNTIAGPGGSQPRASCSGSCGTWRWTGATASAPGTSDSRRCTRSSSTSPPGSREARRLPAGRRHSHQALSPGRYPIHRARGDGGAVPPPSIGRVVLRCVTNCCGSSTTPGLGSRRSPTFAPDISARRARARAVAR